MRTLIVRPGPSFSVQDVSHGWRDGLIEHGVTVADFNFDDRLDFYASAQIENAGELRQAFSKDAAVKLASKGILAACYEFWPDVVIIVSALFVPPETVELIRSRGHKVVLLLTESPYEDDRQIHQADFADFVLLNDPTNLDAFREKNPNTFYVPHAYDPKRHYPGPADPDKACDFAFVGTGFDSRIKFFEAVDFEDLDAVLAGMWGRLDEDSPLRQLVPHPIDWCIDNAEAADLYRSTTSSLNFYRREANEDSHADGWACGPREIELAACGAWFMRDSRPESDELFPMLPTFTEPGEIRPLIDWAKAHPIEREEAALKANAAIADRTFAANAAWLLNEIDK